MTLSVATLCSATLLASGGGENAGELCHCKDAGAIHYCTKPLWASWVEPIGTPSLGCCRGVNWLAYTLLRTYVSGTEMSWEALQHCWVAAAAKQSCRRRSGGCRNRQCSCLSHLGWTNCSFWKCQSKSTTDELQSSLKQQLQHSERSQNLGSAHFPT